MLRLSEAQQLVEGLSDSLLRPALEAFAREYRLDALNQLVQAVRLKERDVMKESFLAGKVEAYEMLLSQLEHFAKEQLNLATS